LHRKLNGVTNSGAILLWHSKKKTPYSSSADRKATSKGCKQVRFENLRILMNLLTLALPAIQALQKPAKAWRKPGSEHEGALLVDFICHRRRNLK
jgi:hypothetical protein